MSLGQLPSVSRRTRPVLRAGLVCGVAGALLLPWGVGAASAAPRHDAAPSAAVVVTASAAATGMVAVPQTVTVRTQPAVATRVVHLQMATSAGWVKVANTRLDSQGRASMTVKVTTQGVRKYRAALWNATGSRVVAYSAPFSVTFAPLAYAAQLSCTSSSAVIRVKIPCTIRVTPTVRLTGLSEVLQVMGRTDWQTMGAWSVPATGVRDVTVEGLEPGVGKYRVLLVRNGMQIAESNTVSIGYSAPTQSSRTMTRVQTWWPTDPIYWNVQVGVTVQVKPVVRGRPVRLQIYGWGGPGWTTIQRGTTNSRGQVWLQMMTMCPDSPCTNTWEQTYRVVVPAWRGYTAASLKHRTLLVP